MADKVTRIPNRSPKASTTMVSRGAVRGVYPTPQAFSLYRLPSQGVPANKNVSRFDREQAIRAKSPTKQVINSGKYAYGPKPAAKPSMGTKVAGALGSVARGAMRFAGPAGALVGMTKPAGVGSDKPRGPLMKGNSPGVGRGPSSKLDAPVRSGASSASKSYMGPTGGFKSGASSASKSKAGPSGGMMGGSGSGGSARTAASKSTTGARGPTGPQGQARSSPTGRK
jgi:hypothetical protein